MAVVVLAVLGESPRSGWCQLLPPVEIKGQPTGISGDAFFGRAVAVDGNVVVVGAPMDDLGSGLNQAGSVVVFELDRVAGTLVQKQILTAPAPASGDQFGSAVDVVVGPPGHPDFLIVGAPYRDGDFPRPTDQGTAYIFRRVDDVWELDAELSSLSAPDASDKLGSAVAIDASVPASSLTGDLFYTAVAASPEADPLSSITEGVVAVYQLVGSPAGWLRTHEFYGAEPEDYPDHLADIFIGESVALGGDVLVAGAPFYDGAEQNSGGLYVFGRGNNLPGGDFVWFLDSVLETSDPVFGQRLGDPAVAVDGTSLIVAAGDPRDDDAAFDAGAVYVFSPQGATEVQKLFASDADVSHDFGTSVALDGDFLIAGATGSGATGALYLFQRDGGPGSWAEIARLTPSDGARQTDGFGRTVALGDMVAVAPMPRDALMINPLGAVYVYDFSGSLFADGFEGGDTSAWSAASGI